MLDILGLSHVIKKKYNLFLFLKNSVDLNITIYFIKKSCFNLFSYLVDTVIFDFVSEIRRFKLCYNLTSFIYNKSAYLFYSISFLQNAISINNLFKSSIWMERECFDMFGVNFINNWDMRKILCDYTFFGFPLRKDFPLSGFVELIYSDRKRSTFEVMIELLQELRFFVIASNLEFWDIQW